MKTKERISLYVDKDLLEIINSKYKNKSKYIERLIYQDLLNNSKNKKIKNMIL